MTQEHSFEESEKGFTGTLCLTLKVDILYCNAYLCRVNNLQPSQDMEGFYK